MAPRERRRGGGRHCVRRRYAARAAHALPAVAGLQRAPGAGLPRAVPGRALSACMDIAARLHPAWHRCSNAVRKLHARNAAVLLRRELDRPVDAVVAWSPDGAVVGGTGMALRIAAEHGVPVLNLAVLSPRSACERLLAIRRSA